MGLIQIFKLLRKYQSCADEIEDLVSFLYEAAKDGKISKDDRSISLKKYWNLLKAIEKVN